MIQILIIIAFTLIVYFRTLRYEIILDDIPWLSHRKKNDIRKDIRSCGKTGIVAWFDEIVDRLYGVGTFGLNIEIEHLFSIVLNCITGALIYLSFGSSSISFWAAILWVSHPLNNQLTVWLNGRRFIINVILVLVMLLSYPFGMILYPLTLAFQVSAVFIPIVFIGKYPWILLAVPVLLAFGLKKIRAKLYNRFILVHDSDRKKFTFKRFYIIVKDYGHYFFKMLNPRTCAFTYPMRYYWGITEKGNKEAYSFNYDFWKGFLALSVTGLGFLIFKGSMAHLWLFMAISTLQWCAIIPATQDLADRYASLPNVFMMFFLSYVVNTYFGVYALPVMIGIVTYYTAMLLQVMKQYEDMYSYWDYARFHFPDLPAPLKYEIGHYLKTDVNKAWMLAKDGLRRNPNEYTLLQQAAVCHKIIGDLTAARVFAEEARKNFYIGQKHIEEPKIQAFLNGLIQPIVTGPSRQVRRAEERKVQKKNKID